MVQDTSMKYEVIFPEDLYSSLFSHLFPGDHDEHGAVIVAGVHRTKTRTRLLVREVLLARDGTEYVAGKHGYRMLTAGFVRDCALYCRDEQLAYLAVHNHGGADEVEFSDTDLASHERGYPALQDITKGQIVGALVFAKNAVAGDIWTNSGRFPLESALILGRNFRRLYPSQSAHSASEEIYDRQIRIFGNAGQKILRKQKVGVIGLGGVGSLVAEQLARLGIGELVFVDADKVELTNIPRIVGSRSPLISGTKFDPILHQIPFLKGDIGNLKVAVAAREARRANRHLRVTTIAESVVRQSSVEKLLDCDYIFLAADSAQARLVFNCLTQQMFIPGVQIGAKVELEKTTGSVTRIFMQVRPVLPSSGCLWCNGLISAHQLQVEAQSEAERRAQRYVDDDEVHAPSVITLNAVAASLAVNDYLFRLMCLRSESAGNDYIFIEPQKEGWRMVQPTKASKCRECGSDSNSRFARGDARKLPTS